MNAWWPKTLLAGLIIVVATTSQAGPIFVGRSLQPSDRNRFSRVGDTAGNNDIPSDVAAQFGLIDPRKSLFVYDCGRGASGWCDDSFFGFSRQLRQAASPFALPTTDPLTSARNQWFASAQSASVFADRPEVTQDNVLDHFQTLAVVNRLDLAKWQGKWQNNQWVSGTWKGAELRFVYGLLPAAGDKGPPLFTLILEFVLPDMDWKTFKKQAAAWEALSAPGLSNAAFNAALKNQVVNSGYDRPRLVRIRLNRGISKDSDSPRWQFFQWSFRTSEDSLGRLQMPVPAALDDQISDEQEAIGDEKPGYLKLWDTPDVPQLIPIPTALLAFNTMYHARDFGLSTPVAIKNPSARIRDILALQQCTFCHTVETGTKFQQVTNRTHDGSSTLSSFLIGNNQPKPTLADLQDPNSPALDRFCLSYCTSSDRPAKACPMPPADSCQAAGLKLSGEQRYFHDLGRRMLFMAALLAAPDTPELGSPENVLQYATDLAH
jgi:hypothetical protein